MSSVHRPLIFECKEEKVLSKEEQITAAVYENPDYAAYFAGSYPDPHEDHFVRFHELLSEGRVLDLGCGGAGDSEALQLYWGYSYVGIDRSYVMLAAGKQNYREEICLLQMEMESLFFKDAVFDGFWASASLMHIPKQKMLGVLQEMRRVVRQGGIGYLFLRMGDFEGLEDDGHGRVAYVSAYQPEHFEMLLHQTGFEVKASDKGTYTMEYFVQVI
jgi:SAM-dependent methyltransferase